MLWSPKQSVSGVELTKRAPYLVDSELRAASGRRFSKVGRRVIVERVGLTLSLDHVGGRVFSCFTDKPATSVYTVLSIAETQLLGPFKPANVCTLEVPVVEDRKLFSTSSSPARFKSWH